MGRLIAGNEKLARNAVRARDAVGAAYDQETRDLMIQRSTGCTAGSLV